MSIKQFQQELSKGLLSPVYLFHSSEDFLLYEALSAVKSRHNAADVFNFDVYDIKSPDDNTPMEQIIDILNTLPFLSDRRTVVIKNIQKLAKADARKLEGYLADPSPASLLVMLHEGASPKLFDPATLKNVHAIALSIPEREIPLWIKMNTEKKGITLTDQAMEHLINSVGTDLGMLYAEIEKLSCIDTSKAIDKDDIKGMIYSGADYNAFDLIDALKRKDAREVFSMLENVIRTQDPQMLLGAINYQYSRQYSGYAAPHKASGKASSGSFEVFRLLHEADADIKSSHKFVIESLLFKLLRLAGRSKTA
ncbi:MAG: DNA polymerase III subunit delta [Nitrospirae bacterium]|nr:DNA polymerase III subunit delta [Nitrospirota bacterium]MCL5236880.1 DNA polymerase III subunit delta [Nitrospirota bacterium]